MKFGKNDIVQIEITDIQTEGMGVGRVDGYALFVKDTVVGDVIEARIVKAKKNYGYGRVERIITPSPMRVNPHCKVARQCGGCQLQAMSYEAQLRFKQNKVKNSLIRIGGFDPELLDRIMEPVIGMEDPWRYRNKAQYPVGNDRNGNPVAGFYAGRTHNIISNTDCLLGANENKEILKIILSHMKKYNIPAYDEETGEGVIRHVLIRKGFNTGQIMVCLVINCSDMDCCEGKNSKPYKKTGNKTGVAALKEKPERLIETTAAEPGNMNNTCMEFIYRQDELLHELRSIEGIKSISVNINNARTNVILGKQVVTLWGDDSIHEVIGGIDFSISPLSFFQVNPVQMEKLYDVALEYAYLTGKEAVWDLYCGIGSISLFMAKKARMVYGVEIVPEAIEDAVSNAERNGIGNVKFFTGKAEEVLPEFYSAKAEGVVFLNSDNKEPDTEEGASGDEQPETADRDMKHPDVIVVDPPRKGCDKTCLDTMLKMQPERIVYVSCDPATLARDLKILTDGGYELKRIRACDMFPHSVHIETAVGLQRIKA